MVLNAADWAILLIMLVSTGISLWRGLVKEAIFMASLSIAIVVAFTFHKGMNVLLTPTITNEATRAWLSPAILFVMTMVVGTVIGKIISKLVKRTGLTGLDRFLGTGFGFLRGTIMVTMAIGYLKVFGFHDSAWWANSFLIPHFAVFEDWSRNFGQLATLGVVSG